MNRAIAWFAGNGVAANLLMVAVLAAGYLSVSHMKLEVFPEFSSDMIQVTVSYRGAAPEEVEAGVCVRIEEAIQDLEGIKRIRSNASEGSGSVTVEVRTGYDTRRLLDDIKTRVDGINTFPVETEKPVVQEFVRRFQVLNIAIHGDADERTLKALGDRVRDQLIDRPEISQAVVVADRPYEITIEVPEAQLRKYGLTFDEVARAVRASSLDLPGGTIRSADGEISLRTKGQAYRGREFDRIVLRSYDDGTRLRLGDVATVDDGFAETDQSARFDGEPCVIVQVFRVGDESALDVADAAKAYIAEARGQMPPGVEMTVWQDDSRLLRDRLDLLLRNGRNGFILVFLLLALFLRLRLAWWVTAGMIMSFFGAFWVMPRQDVSLNMISLFAFVLVLGIVVDDAIVVGESIYTRVEKGEGGVRAAVGGTQSVATPVVFAVLTTVAAFAPLLNVEGNMGKIMRVIPVVVISVLLFSLTESLLVLPAHLSHIHPGEAGAPRSGIRGRWRRFQDRFAEGLRRFIRERYRPLLETALRWRYLTLSAGLAMLIVTLGVVGGGWIHFTFMPKVEADNVVAQLTMPQGTPAEVTAKAVERLEASARQMAVEFGDGDGGGPIRHVLATVGAQPYRSRQMGSRFVPSFFSTGNLAEVNLQLAPPEERTVTSPEIGRRWREITGGIPDAEELTFSSSLFSAGEAVNVQLAGTDYEELQRSAEELKRDLAAYTGVTDITDSFRSGKKEIRMRIRPEAEAAGLTMADLGRQVRQAFYGEEAQRIQRGRDDVRVMVRYPPDERRSLSDLENLRIRLPGGVEVPFGVAATVDPGVGFATITRTDRKRTINVTADVDETRANANDIVADLKAHGLPRLVAHYPSIEWSLEGTQEEQRETMAGLGRGFLFALLLIYILLAVPFRSYSQPLIVMSAIPFGIVGAVWGHVLMGMDLTILSGFGIVALAGVVVNDSLVMVDFVNRERAAGHPLMTAIREAGVARFRPILLTSVTTFAGLTPLLLERSLQAQFLIPMAISLAFGVMFATTITLILVPALYHVLEDAKVAARAVVARVRS